MTGSSPTTSAFSKIVEKAKEAIIEIIKNGKRFNVYHVYTPSHELKTDEFAILLDGLIQECEQQGIDTRSSDEIERDSQLYGL